MKFLAIDGEAPRKRERRNEKSILDEEIGTKIYVRHILRSFGVEVKLKSMLS